MYRHSTAALAAFLALACGAAGGGPLHLRSAVGTNLDAVTYYSPQIPFVDVMKSSSHWISGDKAHWNNGQELDLDARGWVRSLAPGQIARKLMLREFGTRYPGGRYLVRYKGEGKMSFGFSAKVASSRPGEMVLEVAPGNSGIQLAIESTDAHNYLRDIEVLLPGADAGAGIRFNPEFVARLGSYSVLRFMDWMRTNDSPVSTWPERPQVDDATWTTERGVPVEVMVALANLVGAHPWFTIPHLADDDYVRRFAQIVAERLRPDLGVYVEDSNEVWNSQFAQYKYALGRAQSMSPPININAYHAIRSRAIAAAFAAALGKSRVVVVLGTQAANPWTATTALYYLERMYGRDSIGIDAIAIAPYFGASVPAVQAASMTLDQLFQDVGRTMPERTANMVKAYRNIADAHFVRLIAYEGGQHLVGKHGAENLAPLNDLFDAFNRDPRLKDVYLRYLETWKDSGGELFVHFNDVGRYTKWGRWGALEYISQPRVEAPKFDALQTFVERNPPWWQ